MLRNLILDMGNVLIKYDPKYFIERLGIESSEDRHILLNLVFHSPDWPLLDSGELTEAELEARVLPRIPNRLHTLAHQLIFAWDQPIIPIPGMETFIKACKHAGLNIYLLSNASLRQKEYWKRIPGYALFNGRIVSAEHRCVKPMNKIYHCLLDAYHLKAEECFFVDDVKENVDAARREGINGFVFTGDVSTLHSAVKAMGVMLKQEDEK